MKVYILVVQFFVSTVKTLYSVVANFLSMTSLVVICLAPTFWLIFGFKEQNPLFIVYLAGALVWPIVFYVIVLAVVRSSRKARACRYTCNDLPQYSTAADEILYGSNQPIYSPLSLVNAEIPYTNEHFAKYGSMD